MNNFTLEQKQELEALVEAGAEVVTVAYNPTTVIGTPEADAIADGYSVYYREDTSTLVEVIFTRNA